MLFTYTVNIVGAVTDPCSTLLVTCPHCHFISLITVLIYLPSRWFIIDFLIVPLSPYACANFHKKLFVGPYQMLFLNLGMYSQSPSLSSYVTLSNSLVGLLLMISLLANQTVSQSVCFFQVYTVFHPLIFNDTICI